MSPCTWHQADSLTILNRSNTLPIYIQSKISYLEISRKYFFRRRQWSDKNISALEEFFDPESNAKYFKENKSIFVDLMHILHSALTQSGPKAKIVKRTNGGRTQREREREREGKIHRSIVCWWYIHATGLGEISWSFVEIYQCWNRGIKKEDIFVWSL